MDNAATIARLANELNKIDGIISVTAYTERPSVLVNTIERLVELSAECHRVVRIKDFDPDGQYPTEGVFHLEGVRFHALIPKVAAPVGGESL